jgi:hypothetical protein
MKNQVFSFAVLLGLGTIFTLTSCKKDEEEATVVTPTPTALITINEIEEGHTYEMDDTVHIDIDITADFEMHGYDAWLINETAGDTVWSADLHDHGTSFHIHDHWVNNVADHSDMKLKVSAEIDHDGNTTVKEVHFHCHPM